MHVPWCVKKCPYCDFNSHQINARQTAQQHDFTAYVDALLSDAHSQQALTGGRSISSVFFGGGTPSLLPTHELHKLMAGLKRIFHFADDCEITLEANPGTLEHAPFSDYLAAGVNRLSVGVQSFSAKQLASLGRIHDAAEAKRTIMSARAAGFERVNVDIMHGLPEQSVESALEDLNTALDCGASHISWYQLTIEPNTVFYRDTPRLPAEAVLTDIQTAGEVLLKQHGFKRYEVSAWVGAYDTPCQHNLNYWQFGDYLAIGAGAHGKVTLSAKQAPEGRAGVYRFSKSRLPKDYLKYQPAKMVDFASISSSELPFEFMMNALRLDAGVPSSYFAPRTGLALSAIEPTLKQLVKKELLVADTETLLACTDLGKRYLNTLLQHFV